ncbi:MAG: OmpA family protein [Jaaginema sp. PMC 1079.18]|nr:OmpA family protein [Jaaginema sp. PMC 1080.18]MEC4850359.1 OmpA family protein [Jaaginema sp. PMC 1079.18]MEC4867157.1 OmpA family protein [Jaaginema sp. PMC 1078.18]
MTVKTSEYAEYQETRSSRWSGFGRLLFRLFLLGLGGSIAAVVGVVLALANPQPNTEKPLSVAAWEELQQLRQKYWPQNNPLASDTVALPTENLSDTEKQQLRLELNELETELNSLRDRAQELEAKIGISQSDRPLDERFGSLEQALSAESAATSDSLISPVKVKATLPKDALFSTSNQLTDEATNILSAIATELEDYPGSTVRISVHTDASDNPNLDRERSFQQGRTLEKYLKESLGDRYRFVTVGYGQAQPLAPNDTDENRALNRRVEIVAE